MKTKIFLAAGLLASAIGYGQTSALYPLNSTTAGTANVFVGSNNSLGLSNTFVGASAGNSLASDFNTFVGWAAGANSQGTLNSYFGAAAGRFNINGNNSFFGYRSGAESTSASSAFFGYDSGRNAAGNGNAFLGNFAGRYSEGDYNVLIGHSAGLGTSTVKLGSNNVLIGREAGKIATGSGNVLIGYNAGSTLTGASSSNKLFIANSATVNPLIYGEFKAGSNQAQLKFNAQKVGIGYESGSFAFGAFPDLTSLPNGSTYRLFVRGGIYAKEVRVSSLLWADYVFANDYKLMSLKETEQYINTNKHLPNMPSAAEVEEQGIEMGNIIKLQQEKIEELTLHAIANEKTVDELKKEVEELKAAVQLLLKK